MLFKWMDIFVKWVSLLMKPTINIMKMTRLLLNALTLPLML
jgi:hypothetical protein